MGSSGLSLPKESFFQRTARWKAAQAEAVSRGREILESFSDSLASLEPPVQKKLLPLLNELKKEKDENFLFHGLLQIGVRLKSEHLEIPAQTLLTRLSQADVPEVTRRQAEREYAAMAGFGSSAMRAEYLGSRLIDECTNWRMIAPMVGATVVGQVAGAATLGRLAKTASRGFLASKWGSRLSAGTAAFLAEVPTFAALQRAFSPVPNGPFTHDLARSALTLGTLRIFHVGVNPAFAPSAGTLISQGPTFLGLLTANKLEQHFNLRPTVDGTTTLTDTFSTLIALGVGARLGLRASASALGRFQAELRLQTIHARKHTTRTQLQPDAALSTGDIAYRASATARNAIRPIQSKAQDPLHEGLWAMSEKSGKTSSRPPVEVELPKKVTLHKYLTELQNRLPWHVDRILSQLDIHQRDPYGKTSYSLAPLAFGLQIAVDPSNSNVSALSAKFAADPSLDVPLHSANSNAALPTLLTLAVLGLGYLGLKVYHSLPIRYPPFSLPEGIKGGAGVLYAIGYWNQWILNPYKDPFNRGRKVWLLRKSCQGEISKNPVLAEHFLRFIRMLIFNPQTDAMSLAGIQNRLISPNSYQDEEAFFLTELHRAYLLFLPALPANSPELRRALEMIPRLLDRAGGDRIRIAWITAMFAIIHEKIPAGDPQIQAVAELFQDLASRDSLWLEDPEENPEAFAKEVQSSLEKTHSRVEHGPWTHHQAEEDLLVFQKAMDWFESAVEKGTIRSPDHVNRDPAYDSLSYSNWPTVVFDGSLGYSSRKIVNGVPVYSPLLPKTESPAKPPNSGTMILISGAGGDHTSFGELPLRQKKGGWNVKTLVIPGYDRFHSPKSLDVGMSGARNLAEEWYHALKGAVETILEENRDGPVILGGFSLGGAAATRIYEGLAPAERKKIRGLVLAAPAFALTALDTPSRVKNWATRYLTVPAMTEFAKYPRLGREQKFAPELATDIYTLKERPWGGIYATILFGEAAGKSLHRLKKEKDLPPVFFLFDRQDPTVSLRGVKMVEEVWERDNRLLVSIPDADHYIFASPNRGTALELMDDFAAHVLSGKKKLFEHLPPNP